ncbi:MAG TPA: TonB-dependent receptor [Myxococcota bacterium]|nr:TonB-dependent receptor [Myxococcota bacterium]
MALAGGARADDTGPVGTTPVLGSGVPRDQVPAAVQVIERDELEARPTQPLGVTLGQRLPSSALSDTQGSPFNATFELRGYSASPVLGSPQGIAVYQDGQRMNDPFGDGVSWSTLPSFAIDRAEVTPGANPVFGLNAQGGAVALRTKNGFSARGASSSAFGTTFGGFGGTSEYGWNDGSHALYGGFSALHDHGWRHDSPSDVYQGFASADARNDRLAGGVTLTLASADFLGNGPSPVELLDQSYRAVFTTPDETDQWLVGLAAHGGYAWNDSTALEGNAYWRRSQLDTTNGDSADFAPCTGIAGPSSSTCANAGEPDEQVVVDERGDPVAVSAGVDGLRNRTNTRSQAFGATGQLSDHRDLWGLENRFAAGASLDLGTTRFSTRAEAGTLDPSREVDSLGFSLGNEDLNTDLRTQNRYLGAYFTEVLALSPELSATLSGRLDSAHVELHDLRGDELDGTHDFLRFNPAAGLTWRFAAAQTAYLSYAEANRAPTPAELACADPERACRIPNAFTADPDLHQVVSRTIELGARGDLLPEWAESHDLAVRWSAAAYSAWNSDDILFVASGPVPGSGYFSNAGTTRRLGFEAELVGHAARASAYLRYGYVQATFRDALAIASPNNPGADADGEIHVKPGDRMPNVPEHTVKLGLDGSLSDDWSAGVSAVYASSRTYQGDEANLLGGVPGWFVVDAESTYQLTPHVALRLRIVNLFDARYYTAGALGDPSEVFPDFSDPRFRTPGQPRTFELALFAHF